MNEIVIISEVLIALSVILVWTLRFDNIKEEFKILLFNVKTV